LAPISGALMPGAPGPGRCWPAPARRTSA
jgi:hypothetical protein